MPPPLALALAAAMLVGVLVSCAEEEPSGPVTQPGTVTIEEEAANDHGDAAVSAGEKLELEAGDFYFAPTVVTGPGGVDVEVSVTNAGSTVHNLSIDEGSIDQDVEPGATVSVSVRFPGTGSAVFYCKYHRDRGMLGALVAS